MRLRDLFSDDATIDPQAVEVPVTGLAVDSRAVKPGDLFFALVRHQDRWRALHRFRDCRRRRCGSRRPSARRRMPRAVRHHAQSATRAGAGCGEILSTPAVDDRGRYRHQRQDLGRRLHAPDLAAPRPCVGQYRDHRAGFAEANRLRIADDAGSDCAAPAARRNRARGRHPSRLRGFIARARSVSARWRAHQRRRIHQPVARPHGLPS